MGSLLRKLQDGHHELASPPPPPLPSSAHRPSTNHRQSSLLDIPPIPSPSQSPAHTTQNRKLFDRELDKLLDFCDPVEEGNQHDLEAYSLEDLLESASRGAGSRNKVENSSNVLLSTKEEGLQRSSNFSALPGLSGLERDGSVGKQPFDGPPLNPLEESGLRKLMSDSSAPIQPKGKKKASDSNKESDSSKTKPGKEPSWSGNPFASKVPDYSKFHGKSSSHHSKDDFRNDDLDDKRCFLFGLCF